MNESGSTLSSTYRGCRVLVTGHTGFKGSWLCSWLLELGAQITGLALEPNTSPSLFEALCLANRLDSHISDVCESARLRNIFQVARPEIVFHLAAQPLVRRSYADPIGTFATNVLGTAHVLEASRASSSVRAVVVVTTDKVYENREWAWPYREVDRLGGLDPYSASKAAAEILTAVYQRNLCRDSIAIATARGGNVIGGGDWSEDRIIPDIVRAVRAVRPIVLRNPHAIRPWQHVLELCEGYLKLGSCLLASKTAFAQAFNFGPNSFEFLNVRELTELILEKWGCPNHPVEVVASPLRETQVLRLDIAKSLSLLPWRPRLSGHEAATWTAAWYKQYYETPQDAPGMTRNQIHSFADLMDAGGDDR